MLKELEVFRELVNSYTYQDHTIIYCYETQCEIIERALKRLESIDNANPSEAMKMLDDLYSNITEEIRHYWEGYERCEEEVHKYDNDFNAIKQALQQKIVWKHIHNTKVKIPLCSIVNGMNQQERFRTIEHIYYHWEEMKENLENEIISLKNENEKLKSTKSKKEHEQEKALKIIWEKRVNIEYLRHSYNVREYNSKITIIKDGIKYAKSEAIKLTRKEFELLKEMVNNA